MSIAECIAAVQANGPESQASNSPATMYFVIGLVAVVLGLVVVIFLRASARRSSKRQGGAVSR
jgi:FtsH-binding integral membrane protein